MNGNLVMLPVRQNSFIQITPGIMVNMEKIVMFTIEEQKSDGKKPKAHIEVHLDNGTVFEVAPEFVPEVAELCSLVFRLKIQKPTDLVVPPGGMKPN